jgi:hypothetical protein
MIKYSKKSLMLLLAVIVTLAACVDTGDRKNTNTATSNIDSNNDNSVSGADVPTDDCDSEEYLVEECGAEELINCTIQCELEDGEDTPEKKACDKACIKERLDLASELCYEDGCDAELGE